MHAMFWLGCVVLLVGLLGCTVILYRDACAIDRHNQRMRQLSEKRVQPLTCTHHERTV
jgi:4-hydroxybenzoate polyprenyltransferase